MSKIYFHSPSRESQVSGAERAYFGNLCNHLALGIIDPMHNGTKLRVLLPEDNYLRLSHDERGFDRDFTAFFSVGMDDTLIVGGERVSSFHVALNTALAIGNDAIKLAARIHGQCEIYCYVEGKNRKWLAGIIKLGRKRGIYRNNMGWEDVVDLLESSDAEPVVLSYSVTDQFPSRGPADYPGKENDPDGELWYALLSSEQWKYAMKSLRESNGGRWLELTPDNWEDYYFQSGITAFDVINELHKVSE